MVGAPVMWALRVGVEGAEVVDRLGAVLGGVAADYRGRRW
jgi:hypothetical protein